MRRKDREVTEIQELLAIVDSCKVCRLAFEDQEGLYIVPMNFGYEYENGRMTLYFHSAKEGRKITALKHPIKVCFEMDGEHRMIESETACGYGYSFKSIIGNGTACLTEDVEEKKKALSLLMKHQTGKAFTFDDRQAGTVAIIKVEADSFTGKYHK